MAESPVFYYETEVEWKKEKEGQIARIEPAGGYRWSTARIQGTRRNLVS